jgi:phosphoserine phosphatase
MLEGLKQRLGTERCLFFEGSEMIEELVDGGSGAQDEIREPDIQLIQEECRAKDLSGIVTGHYTFRYSGTGSLMTAGTSKDFEAYSHILYLHVSPATIHERRRWDFTRKRPDLREAQLSSWQEEEYTALPERCFKAKIPFMRITYEIAGPENVSRIIQDLLSPIHEMRVAEVEAFIEKEVAPTVKTALVLDADKTLSEADGGALAREMMGIGHKSSLQQVLGSYGYNFGAFVTMAMLYGQKTPFDFETGCIQAARKVKLYGPIEALLRQVNRESTLQIIVITCGLKKVWERVLQHHGFHNIPGGRGFTSIPVHGFGSIPVIGNGQLDLPVVTPQTKGLLVRQLQERGIYVTALGDSPLDLSMLSAADNAVVVVGPESTRSKTMDSPLAYTIQEGKVRARQALMGDVPRRLINGPFQLRDSDKPPIEAADISLPVVDISSEQFLVQVLHSRRNTDGV